MSAIMIVAGVILLMAILTGVVVKTKKVKNK